MMMVEMWKQRFHMGYVWLLLVLCATVAQSQDNVKFEGTHEQNDHDAEGEWEASGKKSYVIDGKENADEKYGTGDSMPTEETCHIDDCSLMQDNDDQSELSMLIDQDEEFSSEEDKASPQDLSELNSKCSKETIQESTDGDATKEAFTEGTPGNEEADKKEEDEDENIIDEGQMIVESEEKEDESKLNKVDPEMENIPLREILLKLKPEGLTDDDEEEDQNSEYSTTEGSMGDESEVEEEALISSGSSEKQDDNLAKTGDSNSTGGISGNTNAGSKKAVCSKVNTSEPVQDVEVINATALMKLLQGDPNITSRTLAGPCYLVYFFSPYCLFSVKGSPYVNAMARSIPNIPVYGLDSIEYHSVNARYGVMGTPTLLLFHNGNGVGRFNASDYSVLQLVSFINHYTDQEITDINVTSLDFQANLPSKLAEGCPYALWAAWVFLLSCASWLFLTSELCARLTEAILNNWREAEAQHDHHD
ncbi:thioredoxin domain-containing protein 15-like isoform X2 [Penaeus chinensis]|uniref:thioredoxin domain-containing protein 15-like isoform X2 n=2 Tax=Penaeus chinensis TaxID=139456 RepID=UPI001FB69DD0|nr:thioredoxin domain-containing protein 15-like isoform X2 [Penaeus chinensis]